jgi:hypothetical protein
VGAPGKLSVKVPWFGFGSTALATDTVIPEGHDKVVLNGEPVRSTAASGCPAGYTSTDGR